MVDLMTTATLYMVHVHDASQVSVLVAKAVVRVRANCHETMSEFNFERL